MYEVLFDNFLASRDSLRVYEGEGLLFASRRGRLLSLLEYINRFASGHPEVVIFDRIVGNAAALLVVKARCCQVCSPLGSEAAIVTLGKYGVKYRFQKTIPYIKDATGERMCPMEKLSLGKGPEEFYEAVKALSTSTGAQGNEI